MNQNRAKIANVWQYINPSTLKEALPTLTRPAMPLRRDVNPAKTLIGELTPDEVEELKALREECKDRNCEYEKQHTAVETLYTLIHKTVSKSYYTYLMKKETLHDMLVALKQRIAPTDQARKLKLTNQYQKLKKGPKTQNIDEWLKLWETTYMDCREFDLPDIAKTRPIYDFLQAVKDMTPDFTSFWKICIQSLEQLGEDVPDIYRILEHFRNHIRIENAEKGQTAHGAFVSSLQGQKLGQKEDEDSKKQEKEPKPCLCGKLHKFRNCYYIVPMLKPAIWKLDPELQKQIDTKIERSSRLREIIERIRKQVASKKEDEKLQEPVNFMVLIFSSEALGYKLQNSVIIDSGASIHVCNNRKHFKMLCPVGPEDSLYAGNTVIPIKGYRNAMVTIKTLKGPRQIELTNAAYIPSFHTTVASLKKFVLKDVHLDMKHNQLTYQDQTFCKLEEHYRQ